MAAQTSDPALDALLLPLSNGTLQWPQGDVLFLGARPGASLRQFSQAKLICEQDFKPLADKLEQAGFNVQAEASLSSAQRYALVLILLPRQREQARSWLARAVSLVQPGGRVIACQHNQEGAKSGQTDLQALTPLAGNMSKFHCRVYWTGALTADKINTKLCEQWLAHETPRPIGVKQFLSRPGVFAWDRIDPASALLASHLPATLSGKGADLGAGFGYLSDVLLERCKGIKSLDLYEAQGMALALAKRNLEQYVDTVKLGYHWFDVTRGLTEQYDFIVSNPPFHGVGQQGQPEVGQQFIVAAAQALRPGGQVWLVANRHLPYEQVLNQSFGEVKLLDTSDGFKVVTAIKARQVKR